jgi:hypothetical protein
MAVQGSKIALVRGPWDYTKCQNVMEQLQVTNLVVQTLIMNTECYALLPVKLL